MNPDRSSILNGHTLMVEYSVLQSLTGKQLPAPFDCACVRIRIKTQKI
jgi:hypothetical protein